MARCPVHAKKGVCVCIPRFPMSNPHSLLELEQPWIRDEFAPDRGEDDCRTVVGVEALGDYTLQTHAGRGEADGDVAEGVSPRDEAAVGGVAGLVGDEDADAGSHHEARLEHRGTADPEPLLGSYPIAYLPEEGSKEEGADGRRR